MTNIQKRIFARHATIISDPDKPIVDVGSVAIRMLLFDKIVFDSMLLVEFPVLAKLFGADGLLQLLSSRAIDIQCEAIVVGQVGQSNMQQPHPLPRLSYSFALLRASDRSQYIDHCMSKLHWPNSLSQNEIDKIKCAIAAHLVEPPMNFGSDAFAQSKKNFLSNDPVVKRSVSIALSRRLNHPITPTDFDLDLHPIGEHQFRAETNIGKKFSIDEDDLHKTVEQSLLAITSFNKKIEEMRRHQALAVFRDGDLPLLDEKLDFLEHQINPEVQPQRLRRVLSITGLPDIESAAKRGELRIPKLIELRESRECREFRDWLTGVDSATDKEIQDQFGSLRAKLTVAAHSTGGKVVRWLASTGIGAVPVIGPILGAAAGLLDVFLVENVLPENGPITFLSKSYPSIFDRDGQSPPTADGPGNDGDPSTSSG